VSHKHPTPPNSTPPLSVSPPKRLFTHASLCRRWKRGGDFEREIYGRFVRREDGWTGGAFGALWTGLRHPPRAGIDARSSSCVTLPPPSPMSPAGRTCDVGGVYTSGHLFSSITQAPPLRMNRSPINLIGEVEDGYDGGRPGSHYLPLWCQLQGEFHASYGTR